MGDVTTSKITFNGAYCTAAGFRFTGAGIKILANGPHNRCSRGLMDGNGGNIQWDYNGSSDTTGWTMDRIEVRSFNGQLLPDGVQPGGRWKGWKFTKIHVHDHHLNTGDNEAICTVMTAGRDASNHLYEDWLFSDCCKKPPTGQNQGQAELISAKVGSVTFRGITITNCDSIKPFSLVLRNTDNCVVERFWCDGNSKIQVHGKNHKISNCKHSSDSGIVMEINNGDCYSGQYPPQCPPTESWGAKRTSAVWTGKCSGGHSACEDVVVEDCASKISMGKYNPVSGQPNKPIRRVTLKNNKNAPTVNSSGAPAGSYTETGRGDNHTTVTKLTPAQVGYAAP
jgi:hypothetical protein